MQDSGRFRSPCIPFPSTVERGVALIGIILVSHGPLAEGLKGAAEMIVGPQEHFLAIGMEAAADVDRLRAQIEAAAVRVDGGVGALVLVDLMGGSPANASAYLAAADTPVICGASLPMLLEVLTSRERTSLEELTGIALQADRDGVVNLTQLLAH